MPDVSIIIVSYNTCALTVDCLRSVYEETKAVTFEVIVVDNASSDGSAEAIATRFPQVQLITLADNLGFASANQIAAKQAEGEFLLLLNPDTVVIDHAIDKIVAFARCHDEAGIIGGRTFFPDGSLNPTSCHGRPTLWSVFCIGTGLSSLFRRSRIFDPESLGRWQRDTVRQVDAVTGCFMLIRKRIWDELGGFDDSFFMYGEETDFCLRANRAGARCLICPEARIIHYGGRSEKVKGDMVVRLFRAKHLLFRKHWHPCFVWFGVAMLQLWALSRTCIFGLLRLLVPSYEHSYRTWRNVWQRRTEWLSLSR